MEKTRGSGWQETTTQGNSVSECSMENVVTIERRSGRSALNRNIVPAGKCALQASSAQARLAMGIHQLNCRSSLDMAATRAAATDATTNVHHQDKANACVAKVCVGAPIADRERIPSQDASGCRALLLCTSLASPMCCPTIACSGTEVHADLGQLQAKIRTTTLTAVVVLGRHVDVLETLGSRKMTGDGRRMER